MRFAETAYNRFETSDFKYTKNGTLQSCSCRSHHRCVSPLLIPVLDLPVITLLPSHSPCRLRKSLTPGELMKTLPHSIAVALLVCFVGLASAQSPPTTPKTVTEILQRSLTNTASQ